MSQSLKDALENVKEIFMSDSALATLLDFERVIDELDVYAFKNWKLGELVVGPVYEKYFITCTWMYPFKMMPDPRGGEQLLNYNCQVTFKKDRLEFPVKPRSPKDFKPGTKVAKTKKVPIWLVTITIPKDLMTEIQKGSVEVENEKLDLEDLSQAYETGADEQEVMGTNQGQMGRPEAGMGSPEMGGGQYEPPAQY